MRAGACTLTHFITDIENTLDAVRQSEDGCLVNLRNVTPQGDGEGGGGGERGFSSTAAVVAKLQVLHIPMIDGPVYVMRFRKATALDRETSALIRSAGIEADIDDARSQDSGGPTRVGVPSGATKSSRPMVVFSGRRGPLDDAASASSGSAASASARLRHPDPESADISRCPVMGGGSGRRVTFGSTASGSPAAGVAARETAPLLKGGDFSPAITAGKKGSGGEVPALAGLGTPVFGRSPVAFVTEPTLVKAPGSVHAGGSVARSKGSAGSSSSSGESQAQALRRSISANSRHLETTLVSLQRAIVIIFALTALMK